ncbi:MAG: PIN domain-containing protein [Chromatiaceae bacterium]|nr:PIN domain-containing protein [Chromatiaceae bacterium]
MVLLDANQTKIPFELASAIQCLGNNAEYVKIGGNGPNALDFHIAFYIGHLAEKDPNAYFRIISKDAGFVPLIKHLKQKKILAQRQKELAEIPLLRISNTTTIRERIDTIVKSLSARGHARPRKVKALTNTIDALFLKTLSESELESIVKELENTGLIVVENESVSYKRPISLS